MVQLIEIGTKKYSLGADLHYAGALGAIWIPVNGGFSPEPHPIQDPKNPEVGEFQTLLRGFVEKGTFAGKYGALFKDKGYEAQCQAIFPWPHPSRGV